MGTYGTPLMQKADPNRQSSLLLVETDAELRRAVTFCLKENGWRILPAGDLEEACRILERETPEILVLDMESPPDRQGMVIEKFREQQADGRRGSVLIATDQRLEEAWRHKYQPDVVVFKPFDVRYLHRRILRLLQEMAAGSA
jgi:two-component system OmpR family response regulator